MDKVLKRKVWRLWRDRLSLVAMALIVSSVSIHQSHIFGKVRGQFPQKAVEFRGTPHFLWLHVFAKASTVYLAAYPPASTRGVPIDIPLRRIDIPLRRSENRYSFEQQGVTVDFYGGELNGVPTAENPSRTFSRFAVLLLSLSLLAWLGFLIRSLEDSKGPKRIPLETQLIMLFPEEFAAELGALLQRMKKAGASPSQIRRRLLEECVLLLWGLCVQIQLQNLWLPSGDRRTDD